MRAKPLAPARFLKPERLEDIAREFLEKYHPSLESPVPIEEIADFDLVLDIIPFPDLRQNWDVDGFLA